MVLGRRGRGGLLAPLGGVGTALLGLLGLEAVIVFDLATCAAAVGTLLWGVEFPETPPAEKVPLTRSAGEGVRWLLNQRGVLDLILFLACINLIASMYNAALPAMVLSRPGGGERVSPGERSGRGPTPGRPAQPE